MKLAQAPLGLKAAFFVAAALCPTAPLAAQTTFTDPANLRGERVSPRDGRELPIDQGATGLAQLLRKLNTRASLMNIVAHPDDEDGGMLTLYSRGLGARVADLSLNRGEGGQNAMTADFEDSLGLLRTQELLASDRYSGVDQFFGTQVDFGFSKTKSESFAKWGHDKVLYDVVRAIRIYRPLVITSTWIGGVTDGHGQHQVSGQIAQEAFVAAGDPKVFPELTAEGILPWQPLKIYARVPMQAITPQGLFDYATGQYVPAEFHNYVTGETSTAAPSVDIVVHEGTKDPLITYAGANAADLSATGSPDTPLSYIQFSRIGLGLQKSQIGPGVRNAPTGTFDVSYHLYGDLTCNAPATLKPPAQTVTSQAPLPQNCHPERSPQDAAEGPASPPAPANPLAPSNLSSQPSFFNGIDTSLEGIAELAPHAPPSLRSSLSEMAKYITEATQASQVNDMPAAAHALYQFFNPLSLLLATLDSPEVSSDAGDRLPGTQQWIALPETEREALRHELRVKWRQADEALADALNLHLDATTIASQGSISSNEDANIAVDITTSSVEPLTSGLELAKVELQGTTVAPLRGPQLDKSVTAASPFHGSLTAPASTLRSLPVTRPYFSRNSIEEPVYKLASAALRNAPETPAPLVIGATLFYRLHPLHLLRVVQDDDQPIRLVPPINVSLSSHAQILPSDKPSLFLNLTVAPASSPATEEKLTAPPSWTVLPAATAANCAGCHPFNIQVPTTGRSSSTLYGSVRFDGRIFTEGYRPIGYGNLPRTNLYTPATIRIVPADLKLPERHKIAYLPGTGDSIPEALASLDLAPTILTVSDLVPERLKQYDTVILGVRTYNAHPDLHGRPTQALIEYARNGGNVLVQFQTQEFTSEDAPYPLDLGTNEKVVDETAPVTLLAKANPILTTPNVLTPADFNGWNEERGHGFLSTWDDHYTPLLEVHDPGEPSEHILPQKPQRGGLLTVQLGKGRWTYCAYALYRQLPEAVPGAFRLFANLITP